ncbi:MAG TPA: hypothetical protein VNN80_12215 [Polyangiaceae bacterium]|nr:hypothetical protein [Polyangiaceae bacterium]
MAFEAILSEPHTIGRAPLERRQLTLTFSILVHALALGFGVAHSIWQVGEMPLPAYEVTLSVAPPPALPPPPPKRAGRARKKPADTTPKVISAPRDTPEPQPEPSTGDAQHDADDVPGEDAGEDAGEDGGVPGGIGPGLAPPPPPESRGPKLLTMQAGNELLAINPNVRPYRVNVPEELTDRMGAGEKISPVIRICVTAQGSVHSVALLKSSLPLIDQQLPSVIRRWKYRPLLVAGESRPFCYVTKYSIAAT